MPDDPYAADRVPIKFRNDEERIFWKHAVIRGGVMHADICVRALRERMPDAAGEEVCDATGWSSRDAGYTRTTKDSDPDPNIVGGYQRSSLVKLVRKVLDEAVPDYGFQIAERALRDATGWSYRDAHLFVQECTKN